MSQTEDAMIKRYTERLEHWVYKIRKCTGRDSNNQCLVVYNSIAFISLLLSKLTLEPRLCRIIYLTHAMLLSKLENIAT